MAWLGALNPEHFIDTFCDAETVGEHGWGELGRFTPCFTDLVVLGMAHITAIILVSVRIAMLRAQVGGPKFRLVGGGRALKWTSVVASVAALLVVLFQLNARIASDASPLISGKVAPFEWAGYAVSILSWAAFVVAYVTELNRYSLQRSWLVRFPILLIFAGELAKLRFVLERAEVYGYFFFLYIAYVALEAWLAMLGLMYYPGSASLEPLDTNLDESYVALATGEVGAGEVCPEATANIFSSITFAWIGPLLRKGYKRPLQTEDIWELPPGDHVSQVASRFEKQWSAQLHKPTPSLVGAMWGTTWWLYVTALPFKLTCDASQFVGPTFLNLLLGVVSSGANPALGYLYASLMLLLSIAGSLADAQHFQRVMRAGFRQRALLNHEVFKKVVALAPDERARFSSGRVFNLVTSDAETLQMLSQNIMGFISSPLRIIGAMGMLYLQLGPSSLVALLSLILMMPIQAYMVRLSSLLLKRALSQTDERAKLEGELLGGIEVVKCNAWEESFWERIQAVREGELATLWKSFVVASVNSFLLQSIPALVSVLTFTVYVLMGNTLTAANAFTSLALFTVLRLPLFQLPQLIAQWVNARVAVVRLQEFLAAREQPSIQALPSAPPGEDAIELQGEFTWDLESAPSLLGLDLKVAAGSLVVVVGPTGSGKSSLLSAVLGLMLPVEGAQATIRGKVAYVPQAAFIYNATIRDNILFGLPYDAERYARAVGSSSLVHDLQQFPAGDMTELGERGVNVSGGQKQRISIARAVYSCADVVLLDDPLSALDAKVAREVFSTCLAGELRGQTRLLVTNQLQFLRSADAVVFMQAGRMLEVGTYAQLQAAGGPFAQMMRQTEVEQEETEIVNGSDIRDIGEKAVDAAHSAPQADKNTTAAPAAAASASKPDAGGGGLVEREGRSTGRVSGAVLGVYVKAMGGTLRFSLLILWFLATEAARVAATVWLSYWTSSTDDSSPAPHTAFWYLAIYAAISLAQVLFTLLSQFVLKGLSVVAARTLHNSMLARLMRAPMAFFHTTPLGRIINRLTKDTADVDKNLADFAAFFFRSALQLVSTIVLIGAETPLALPAIIPILLFFWFLYQYFQASVREVKRLDSISRSPVYSSISEALSGLATIRAYRAEGRLSQRNAELVDRSVVMSLVNMSMNRWLSVRLESLGSLAAFAAACLLLEQRGNASTFGLVLSYALQITALTSMTVRLASIAESSFNAVERIDEFCHLKEEAAAIIAGSRPDGWPNAGKVEFVGVKMRYRAGLPLVLKGLSVTIQPGSRCGVVGRTGAGKTSVINCIFRLIELDEGRILIDELDIAKLGLHQLRSSLAIIPQVPVLFTGSMRSNLTPFGEHSDAECWAALRRAHLAAVVEGNPQGLDMLLTEGGAPLSAGQKQLVALARALLRHSKVLILDEATANVDVETDALIQATVREEFSTCTLIAIAHRLHTIIDADSVIVMDRGVVAEAGSPADLLSNPAGSFSSMVAETGEATARFLRSVASGEAEQRAALQRSLLSRAERGRTKACMDLSHANPGPVSGELVDKARSAAALLQQCLAILQEAADGEEVRRSLDIDYRFNPHLDGYDPDSASAVQRAVEQALELVGDVHQLAEYVRNRFGRGGGGGPPDGGRRSSVDSGSGTGGGLPGLTPRASRSLLVPAAASACLSNSLTPRASAGWADSDRRGSGLMAALEGCTSGGSTPRMLLGPPPAENLPPEPIHEEDGGADEEAGTESRRRWARSRGVAVSKSGQLQTGYLRLAREDPTVSQSGLH